MVPHIRFIHAREFAYPSFPDDATLVFFDAGPPRARPRLRLELADYRCARIVADETLAYIQVGRWRNDAVIHWTPRDVVRVLPPIERHVADDIAGSHKPRERTDRWMRWMAGHLDIASGPIDYGPWVLKPGKLLEYRMRSFVHQRLWDRVETILPNEWTYLWWGSSGGDHLLPQRRLPPRESGRVKAMRKLAREGRLPPLLVWPIDAFGLHVLLDGHERLAAALAERVWPEVIELHAAHVRPGYKSSDEERKKALAEAEQKFALSGGRARGYADRWVALHDERPDLLERVHAYRWPNGREQWASITRELPGVDRRVVEIVREG